MSQTKEIMRKILVNAESKAVVSSFTELVKTAVGVYSIHPQHSSVNLRSVCRKSQEFVTHDSGKTVWVRACWQNARCILGRWSEAKSAIVP